MSNTFDGSPEYAHIRQLVQDGVDGVNKIVSLLTPATEDPRSGDPAEMTFSDGEVSTFQAYTAHAIQIFTNASDTSNQWFNDISGKISVNIQRQGDLQMEVATAEQQAAALEADFNSNVERSKQLAEKHAQNNAELAAAMNQLQDAERRLQVKKEEQERIRIASNATSWIPFVSMTLAIIDMTAEQNSVNTARDAVGREAQEANEDNRVLEETKNQIQTLQREMSEAEAQRHLLQQRLAAASAEIADLETTRSHLVAVKTSMAESINALYKALSSLDTVDDELTLAMSLGTVKILAALVQIDDSLLGEVATLDEESSKRLDGNLLAIRKRIASQLPA